jgi:hypothetical protein
MKVYVRGPRKVGGVGEGRGWRRAGAAAHIYVSLRTLYQHDRLVQSAPLIGEYDWAARWPSAGISASGLH